MSSYWGFEPTTRNSFVDYLRSLIEHPIARAICRDFRSEERKEVEKR